MAKFSQPIPDSVRPAASVSGPSAVDALKQGGSKMVSSKASPQLGGDVYTSLDATGTSIATDAGLTPLLPKPAPDGKGGNVASQDPDISAANVIGPTAEGKQKNKPGRQESIRGQTGGRANGWVTNTPSPIVLAARPKKGA